MKGMPKTQVSRSQLGLSLIEVMISVLILAVGVLGIAAMQAITLKNAGSSASRTQASIQVYSMMDLIRADRANLGSYNTNVYAEGDGSGTPGTMMGWLDGLKTTVAPDAKGRVVCVANSMSCSVGVQWSDERGTGGSSTPIAINITSQL
ncbi:MAG: type IV pilus modification protein PilV [Thermomonas sp.]